MNEPLTTPPPGVCFSGKTHNNHPQWSNQPLRLTNEQKQDPLLVFTDFFECYHLKDVRENLWQWVSEVVASPYNISSEPLARSGHLYFYEKMELIIEAAFVLKKKLHKSRLKNEKRKLKRNTKGIALQANKLLEPSNLFNKEKRLIEYANEDPLYVIREALKPGHRSFLIHTIQDWLLVALSTEDPSYDDCDQRQNLITFQDHLLSFIEAIYIILINNTEEGEYKERLKAQYKIYYLTSDQKTNPAGVITGFFDKYSLTYIQRELEDWHDAAINNHGPWREDIACAWHVIDTYRKVRCLVKAAKRLIALKIIIPYEKREE